MTRRLASAVFVLIFVALGLLSGSAGAQETTTTSEATTTTVAPTTTTTVAEVLASGEDCPDVLACERVQARDIARMRAEVLIAAFLLVMPRPRRSSFSWAADVLLSVAVFVSAVAFVWCFAGSSGRRRFWCSIGAGLVIVVAVLAGGAAWGAPIAVRLLTGRASSRTATAG